MEADEVHSNYAVGVAQGFDDGLPLVQSAPQAVQEDDRRSVAGFGIVNVLTENSDILVDQLGRQGPG